MIEQIKAVINDYPKLFSQQIKKDPDMIKYVNDFYGDTLSEKVYNAINNSPKHICPNKNKYKFKSLREGYKFCGRASVCKCAKQSVSKNVKESKKHITKKQQQDINEKRKKTTIAKYGVENNGQTEIAKKKHTEFYASNYNIDAVNNKIQSTLQDVYGVTNARDIPGVNEKIQTTLLEKYGVHNIAHIAGVVDKRIRTKNERYPSYGDHMLQVWYDKLKIRYENNDISMITDVCDYKGVGEKCEFVCTKCNSTFKFKPSGSSPMPVCKKCHPVHGSKEQQEVYDFIKSLGVNNIIVNDRTVLNGKELDIYIPDYNLAIEYNGVYWHNDSRVEKNYHYDKFKACKENGIQLYSIFSSYWKNNTEIIKAMIRSKLGLNANSCYARKCTIKAVSQKLTNEFLDANHVFGSTISKIRLGLFYEDNLVALMLFNSPRLGIGKNQVGYELVRYASNTQVTGGASKLLKYFIRNYNPDAIYSFSDNCYSNGNLYKILGFKETNQYKPTYWYCDPSSEKMYHRFNFRKDKLVKYGFDKDKFTEREMMTMLGFWRIWDTGKSKWELNLK